jgi:hypothetical protein
MTLTLPLKNHFRFTLFLPVPLGQFRTKLANNGSVSSFLFGPTTETSKTEAVQLEHKPTSKHFDSD